MENIKVDKTIEEVRIDIAHHKRQILHLEEIKQGHYKVLKGLRDYLEGLQHLETFGMFGIRADEEMKREQTQSQSKTENKNVI